jgi:hypothetical protein
LSESQSDFSRYREKSIQRTFYFTFENRFLLSHEEAWTFKMIRVNVQLDMWWVPSSILSLNRVLDEHGGKNAPGQSRVLS